MRNTFISVVLTTGCNQKWIAEQTETSIAMIPEYYGKYIRDDGDALLRAYVEASKPDVSSQKTEIFSDEWPNCRGNPASPAGFEPVLSA